MLTYTQMGLHRKISPGLDFTTKTIDNLKSVDPELYLIRHPYRVLWDDIINEYEGRVDDPRNTIHLEHGEVNFGYVLTDGQGSPIEDNSWHIWRFNKDHGWAHVIKLEALHPEYIEKVINRLFNYRVFTQKYGFKSYNRLLAELKDEEREKMMRDEQDLAKSWNEENKWLVNRAKENFSRGIVKPTNPQKEIITSFSGQTNKSRIIRPIDERDGGVYNG